MYGSSGQNEQLESIFPDLTHTDWEHQFAYTFYSETFFSKVFSALDTISQILDEENDLGLKKPSFKPTVEKLVNVNPQPGCSLKDQITSTPEFMRADDLRNDITHNFAPGVLGASMTKQQTQSHTVYTSGIGEYTKVADLRREIISVRSLLENTLNLCA